MLFQMDLLHNILLNYHLYLFFHYLMSQIYQINDIKAKVGLNDLERYKKIFIINFLIVGLLIVLDSDCLHSHS